MESYTHDRFYLPQRVTSDGLRSILRDKVIMDGHGSGQVCAFTALTV